MQPLPGGVTIRHFASPNFFPGRPHGAPIAFVVHTEAGNETGTIEEFDHSSSQVSAHFGASLGGMVLDQFVDLGNSAWANGILEPGNLWRKLAFQAKIDPTLNPNYLTISCETEDHGVGTTAVSDDQYTKVLYAALLSMAHYPNSLKYLTSHFVISPQTRPHCAGDRWITSGRLAQLARDTGLTLFVG